MNQASSRNPATQSTIAPGSSDGTRLTPGAADRSVSQGPRVSIVTPCLNGASYLENSLKRLLDYLESRHSIVGEYEIIFVDDGSSDGSAAIVANQFPAIRIIRHATNRGKGAAVRSGMLSATGRFLFFIDADIPYGLDALEMMLDYLDRKEFHICIGTRSRGMTTTLAKRSLARRAASVAYTATASRIVITGIRDTQCGFKGFRSDVAKHLFGQSRTDNFAFDVEVLYLAFKSDLDIKKVPVELERDDNSSVSLLRHALPMLCSILALPFRYHTGGYTPMHHRWNEDG